MGDPRAALVLLLIHLACNTPWSEAASSPSSSPQTPNGPRRSHHSRHAHAPTTGDFARASRRGEDSWQAPFAPDALGRRRSSSPRRPSDATSALGPPIDRVTFEGPAYDGCCDPGSQKVLDCCTSGGCCGLRDRGDAYVDDDGAGGFLGCCSHTSGTLEANARRSRVTYSGPSYDGCCPGTLRPLGVYPADGRDEAPVKVMDCCNAGGCCPNLESGVVLDCCGARHASVDVLLTPRLGDSDAGVAGDGHDAEGGPGEDADAAASNATSSDVSASGADRVDEPRADGARVSAADLAADLAGHGVSAAAFTPAEESSSTDPVYGGYATTGVEPGGEGYYSPSTEEQAAAARDVAAAANDDSTAPGDVSVDVSGDGIDADGDGMDGEAAARWGRSERGANGNEDEMKRPKLHTRRWWERHGGGRGGGGKVSWRVLVLQGAAALCVVAWLTSLVVGAILKRTDGRREGQRGEQQNLLA